MTSVHNRVSAMLKAKMNEALGAADTKLTAMKAQIAQGTASLREDGAIGSAEMKQEEHALGYGPPRGGPGRRRG
ncbi:MAG TPA: hypothetical protein VNL35_11975 [Chloroflexota bacterium]|nr:hypothetical protein [Chloroflexota bacterium]